MRLFINASNRDLRKISLFDSLGKKLMAVEGSQDVLELIDRCLNQAQVNIKDLTEVSAEMKGPSRVGINIGVSAANALNYTLGLKRLDELTFPANEDNQFG